MRYPTFVLGILLGAAAARAVPILAGLEGLKEEDYRIHRADDYRVDRDGWSGYGYNWLLEVTPPGMGGSVRYSEVRFFSMPGQTLIRQGAWSSFQTEEAPHFATPPRGHDLRDADLPLAYIGETAAPAVPEPGSLALFGLGLVAVAGVSRLRRKR